MCNWSASYNWTCQTSYTNNSNLIYQNDVDFVPKKKFRSFFLIFKKTPFMIKQMGEYPIVNIIFILRSAYPLTNTKTMYSNQNPKNPKPQTLNPIPQP